MVKNRIYDSKVKKDSYLLSLVEKKYMKDVVSVSPGDVLQVKYLVPEGNKERVQKFEGLVIAKKHGGINQTIIIRRFIGKFGLEQVLFVHSPKIMEMKVLRKSKIRRAKLYYIKKAVGKAARLKRKI